MEKVNCEVFFFNKDIGEAQDAQLDVKTGFIALENLCVNQLTAPKKWIEFTYEGQEFKVDACVREGKIKVKNKKDLSAIRLHMNLEESLIDKQKPARKMKI